MKTHQDQSIEFWGNVYQACRLEGESVTFASFLENPHDILTLFGMEDAIEVMESGFLPLLPKQARIRARLEQAVDDAVPQQKRIVHFESKRVLGGESIGLAA